MKAVYSRVFTWLVERINHSLTLVEEKVASSIGAANAKVAVMGILDIYGFEIFRINRSHSLLV
jgi:myosin heavy subunit